MRESLLGAASDCDLIVRRPESGEAFNRLRKRLKLVEGCCRQAAHWREDARWLTPGMYAERAHQIAREWLHRPSVVAKKLFKTLASALRNMARDLDRLQHMPSGKAGRILVPQGDGSYALPQSGRTSMPGGLIMPRGVGA